MKYFFDWLRRGERIGADSPKLSPKFRMMASEVGVVATARSDEIELVKDSRVVRIGARHEIYAADVCKEFEHYFGAVEPIRLSDGRMLADYSLPRWHDVSGFTTHPIHFPSLPEPIETTSQYLEFACIKSGDCVLDLGAYAGLTSILFSRLVGANGLVIAVEPDQQNIASLKKTSLFIRQRGVEM